MTVDGTILQAEKTDAQRRMSQRGPSSLPCAAQCGPKGSKSEIWGHQTRNAVLRAVWSPPRWSVQWDAAGMISTDSELLME